MRSLVRRAAIAAGAAAMLVVPAGAVLAGAAPAWASPPSATIQLHNQLQLQSDGTLLITLTYSCLSGLFGTAGSLNVEVDQPGTVGLSQPPATCDGQKHNVVVQMVPVSGYPPFTPGPAGVLAAVANQSSVSSATTQAQLKIMAQSS